MPAVPPGYIGGVGRAWIMTQLLLLKYITLLAHLVLNIIPTLPAYQFCRVLCVVSSSSQAFGASC
jgi:hypothetical protein